MRKMNYMAACAITVCMAAFCLAAAPVFAQHDHSGGDGAATASPYVDMVDRQIATLSEQDVTELLSGAGWGFALPAELNGLPGPRHVLDMADEIGLSDEQNDQTQVIFDAMQAEAVRLGQMFVDRERALDTYFTDIISDEQRADRDRMAVLVDSAGAARARLRTIHLAAHLQMIDVLTDEQIVAYSRLRGYMLDGTADPCENVPEGHDPEMWRRHNDCDG